ncbi:unnamed protein product [Sphagnum tenellum]
MKLCCIDRGDLSKCGDCHHMELITARPSRKASQTMRIKRMMTWRRLTVELLKMPQMASLCLTGTSQTFRYWAHPQSILFKQRSFLQPHTAIEKKFQIHVHASPASFLIL